MVGGSNRFKNPPILPLLALIKKGENVKEKISEWLMSGKVGTSSKTIASIMSGIDIDYMSHPLDPADFNRCLLLVEYVPEIKDRLPEMSKVSEQWATLVRHWDELEALFISEVGRDWCNETSAPKTYNKMQELGL